MPYAEDLEPRHELKEWMREQGVTLQDVATRCNISRQAISQYVSGSMHSPKVRKAFLKLGCPEEYLKRKSKPRAEAREVKPIRVHTGYYDPWQSGDIRLPYGLPPELSGPLTCPFL
ncbi:MAG: helix-turn-helix domain-containing protein [Archaeoglobaceae archaeon]